MMISHDLNASADFCDRVAVMYLGKIVEIIQARSIFVNCRHPYLKAFVSSRPNSIERSCEILAGKKPGQAMRISTASLTAVTWFPYSKRASTRMTFGLTPRGPKVIGMMMRNSTAATLL